MTENNYFEKRFTGTLGEVKKAYTDWRGKDKNRITIEDVKFNVTDKDQVELVVAYSVL